MAGLAYNPNRYGLLAPQSFTPWPLGFSSALPALTISSPHTIESHLMVYTPESVEIVGSYAMKEAVLLLKVQKLGGVPTIGDMGMLVRGAMRTPWPEAVVSLLQHSHKLGYVFGSKLYTEAVTLCLSLGEKDAAINIITDMEEVGVAPPQELLTDILKESDNKEV